MYRYLKGELPSPPTANAGLGHSGLRTTKQEMPPAKAPLHNQDAGDEQLPAMPVSKRLRGVEMGQRCLAQQRVLVPGSLESFEIAGSANR